MFEIYMRRIQLRDESVLGAALILSAIAGVAFFIHRTTSGSAPSASAPVVTVVAAVAPTTTEASYETQGSEDYLLGEEPERD